MQAFDAKMSETKDMEVFAFDVEEDKDIQDKPAPVVTPAIVAPLATPAAAANGAANGRHEEK